MKKRCYSICVILWVLITTLSATSPTTFHIALKKIYPHATNVSWSQQGNYYVASFTQNGFEKEVWMNGNAQWVNRILYIQYEVVNLVDIRHTLKR